MRRRHRPTRMFRTNMRYRITISSPEIYIVDTDSGLYWPERYPANKAARWRAMDPRRAEFRGTVIEKLEDK